MDTATETQAWEFDLSLLKPLNANDRPGSPFARNRQVQALREEACMMAKVAQIPRGKLRKVRVQLTYTPAAKRRRDADNLAPTLKAICDGLVDAKVVSDDTPAEMEKPEPIIARVNKKAKRRLKVRVEQLM